jgi:hypothetical protein
MPAKVFDRMCGMPCSVICTVTPYAGVLLSAVGSRSGVAAWADATAAVAGVSRSREATAMRTARM